MSTTVKVSRRYQIALSSAVRKRLAIDAGDRLLVDVQDGLLKLIPRPKSYTDQFAKLNRQAWSDVDGSEYLEGERDSWAPSSCV